MVRVVFDSTRRFQNPEAAPWRRGQLSIGSQLLESLHLKQRTLYKHPLQSTGPEGRNPDTPPLPEPTYPNVEQMPEFTFRLRDWCDPYIR